jgi:PAS domain S-box-containing protein
VEGFGQTALGAAPPERRWRGLDDLACAVDAQGRFTMVNGAWERMLGWAPSAIEGTQAAMLLHPEDLPRLLVAQRSARLLGRFEGVRVRCRSADGSYRWLLCSGFREDGAWYGIGKDITDARSDAWDLVVRVRDAIARDRLVVEVQPIFDLRTRNTVQFALLIRLPGPGGKTIPLDRFPPAAADDGLVADLDRWAIARACGLVGRLSVELRLSVHSIAPGLVEHLRHELERCGADPSSLVLELTETALVEDATAVQLFAERVGALGCKLALDDFGSGFGCLRRLPVDYLKIDREFVRDLLDGEASEYVVRAVVSLARGFGQRTIADGAEDVETLAMLRDLGVDLAQGPAVAEPMNLDEATGWPGRATL